jgi:hypothetical protein
VAECAIRTRPPAPASAAVGGIYPRVTGVHPVRRAGVAGVDRHRLLRRAAAVMMGDIGEEITEIELEPLPEEAPAEPPVEPVTEPAPG